MIVGIGCDIVDHQMTQKLNWESESDTLERIFSSQEIDIFNKKKTSGFLDGRFAAKEAVLKCMGTGMIDGISLKDVEILEDGIGRPIVKLSADAKVVSEKLGIDTWHLSIAHLTTHSVAFAIAEHVKSFDKGVEG